MPETVIRSERHDRALTEYHNALGVFQGLTGLFRASIPTLTQAQVRINRALDEISAAAQEAENGQHNSTR